MSSIIVKDFPIRIKEGYFSLTDISKNLSGREPGEVIRDWLRKQDTLAFLKEWERVHGKHGHLPVFSLDDLDNARGINVSRYIERGGTGLTMVRGRGGGTYAEVLITLNFINWLSPVFSVWFFTEWVRMKETEQQRQGIEFFLQKSISNIDETSNLLREVQAIIERQKKLKP